MIAFTQGEALAATVALQTEAFRELWDDEQSRTRLIIYRRAIQNAFYSDVDRKEQNGDTNHVLV